MDLAFPAFGLIVDASGNACGEVVKQVGLSKRELFAAMAMQGILANDIQIRAIADASTKHSTAGSVIVADLAVEYADDLIARLSKPAKGDS